MHKAFFVFLLSLTLGSCYYTTQGYYLFSYTYTAKKIDKLLQSEKTSTKTKKFLNRVNDIKSYAQKIGLSNKKKYNSYKQVNRDYLVAVVQAAEKFSVDPYTWYYPFMGKLPYKGYYNVAHAKQEAERLELKGYETYVRKVSAFSTLNFLPDPIYSFMQNDSISNIAETLLHEQVHSTLWIKGQHAFNEQLATFIGRESMISYIKETYSENSKEYQEIFINEHDELALRKFLLQTKNKLSDMYLDKGLSDEEKLISKENILATQQHLFLKYYDTMFTQDTYKNVDMRKLNNAFFALISVYENSSNDFQAAYQRCGQDIKVFISQLNYMREFNNYQYKKNPYEYLKLLPLQLP